MEKKWIGLAAILVVLVLVGGVLGSTYTLEKKHHRMSFDEKHELFNTMKADMTHDQMLDGHFKCCLEKPCVYCLSKYGCDCLEDIMTGKHPCGECIGEIMEGHGNKFLSPYFATAIAEKVGEQHTNSLKAIIADMYDITVEEQI